MSATPNRNERPADSAVWREEYRRWRKLAAHRPKRLTPIPEHRRPPVFADEVRLEAWESQAYLAQWYAEQPFNGIPTTRLSICRYPVVKIGQWEGGFLWEDVFGWEELMAIKAELGFADVYALEVYPPAGDTVCIANSRHLWMFASPLPIGWSLYRPTNGGNATLGASK